MQAEGVKAGEMVAIRSLLAASVSLFCLALALTSFFLLKSGEPARILAGLIALFCGQGFVSELIGFRCDRGEVSFPRRLFPKMGFLTLWRRRISTRKISRVDTLGDRVALLYLNSTERVQLVFPDSDGRHEFTRFLGEVMESRRQARRPGHRTHREGHRQD